MQSPKHYDSIIKKIYCLKYYDFTQHFVLLMNRKHPTTLFKNRRNVTNPLTEKLRKTYSK